MYSEVFMHIYNRIYYSFKRTARRSFVRRTVCLGELLFVEWIMNGMGMEEREISEQTGLVVLYYIYYILYIPYRIVYNIYIWLLLCIVVSEVSSEHRRWCWRREKYIYFLWISLGCDGAKVKLPQRPNIPKKENKRTQTVVSNTKRSMVKHDNRFCDAPKCASPTNDSVNFVFCACSKGSGQVSRCRCVLGWYVVIQTNNIIIHQNFVIF